MSTVTTQTEPVVPSPSGLLAVAARPGTRVDSLLLAAFTAAIFTSAALLFLVQPMFSKMALPLLGGTPAVWNTCMLFFQTTLLAGYLYAHLSTRWLGVRRQAALHLAILVVALFALPITIPEGWTTPSGTHPTFWLLGLLSVSMGLPFFILSSSGPLFQKWFAHTGHQDAENPYFLYAASNLGSMLALLAYPVLIEPRLRIADQSDLWAVGFGFLMALTLACASLLWWRLRDRPDLLAYAGPAHVGVRAADGPATGLATSRRARWVLLAFAPSSLLLGVTTYITTDIAAVPLLWVIPLALYLLTFILVFARRQVIPHALAVRVQPHVLIPLALLMFWGVELTPVLMFGLHLSAFFVTVMVCHGELARDRPAVSHLTEFYLWISVGGALGGAFNTLIAPTLFNTIAEYPLILVLACFLRPRSARAGTRADRWLDVGLPALLGLAGAAAVFGIASDSGEGNLVLALVSIILALVCLSFESRPLRFGLGIGALLLSGIVLRPDPNPVLLEDRTFFGTHRVSAQADGMVHALNHGTTLHGTQLRYPGRELEITTYYHREGPVGQIFEALRERTALATVGVVGLGTGSTACYGSPGERWTYFEIDRLVEVIARDPRYFTFLRDCPPDIDVVLGDARLTLAQQPEGKFDLLIVDAFSSDAIPLHLLTREAVSMYLDRLAPEGILALHVSNRHLVLEPVLASLQESLGIPALFTYQAVDDPSGFEASSAMWSVFARNSADLGSLMSDERWAPPLPRAGLRVWTDDFANILSVYRWR